MGLSYSVSEIKRDNCKILAPRVLAPPLKGFALDSVTAVELKKLE